MHILEVRFDRSASKVEGTRRYSRQRYSNQVEHGDELRGEYNKIKTGGE